ncbi:MAG: type IX secretion system protein PorQ [Saprospiraceae bacterium]
MQRFLPLFTLLLFYSNLSAQVGGNNVFEFLNFSTSARITAVGGHLITVRDDDVALAYANPAALNEKMHQQLSFNHNIHLAGIGHGYFAYAHHVEKWQTTLHGGIQYLDYGDFQAADENGTINGTFDAAEYAITLGGGRRIAENYTVGVNAKFITSQLESYSSLGLSADAALMYQSDDQPFTFTFLLKNIGTQLTQYRIENPIQEDLPFEIQTGISYRLKYLPLRLSLIYHDLQRWNITYDDPNNPDESTFFLGEEPTIQSDNFFFDNLMRHFVFNGEFLFGKNENFRVRFGYNHQRRQELAVRNLRSLAGFSFGLGLKINRFRVEYGQGIYHLGGSMNHFSISTNLKEFKRKKVKQ